MLESSVGTDMEPLIDEPHWWVSHHVTRKESISIYFSLPMVSKPDFCFKLTFGRVKQVVWEVAGAAWS